MDDIPLLPLLMRWMHILSACIALGGPFFVRFALLPAASAVLDPETHHQLRERVNAQWRHIVHMVIALFLISGIYNYTTLILGWGGGKPWPLGRLRADYQALFTLKMALALWVFFLASALCGRSKALAFFRTNARLWLAVLIVCLLVILMLSSSLRALRDRAAAAPAAATLPATSSAPSIK